MLNKLLLNKKNFALFLTFLPVAFFTLLPGPSQCAEMPSYARQQPVTSSITGAIDTGTDQSNRLYVADSAKDNVVIFDASGQYEATVTGLSHPLCVDVDSNGNIYIGNKNTENVEVYDSSYSFLRKLGSGDGEFIQPNDLAIAAAGQIYVVDRGADVVKIYNSDGTYSTSFGSSGYGDGEFHRPVSIAIDEAAQELIVLDRQPYFDEGVVWIDGARIQVFTMAGVFKRGFTKLAEPYINPEELYKPQRVTVDEQSRLYVTDSFQNVVQVYDSINGNYLGTIYDLQDPLRTPVGITLGGNNLLYVAARGTGKVEVYQLGQGIPASASSAQDSLLGVSPSSFTRTPIPRLSVTPTPSAMTYTSTDGSIPSGQVLSIKNIGSGTLTWSASAYPSWIKLDKTSGNAPESIMVEVDIASLAAGEHIGAITITGDGALSSPTHVGVTLTIVQSAPGTVELPPGDGDKPSDNKKAEFPWILYRHLLGPR